MNEHADNPSWRIVRILHLSWDEWPAYERDMNDQDDSERWILEMEGEASAACKQHADLKTSNTPT